MLKTTEKLGEILVKSGIVSEAQMAKALEVQRGSSKRIGEVLVELRLATEVQIATAISQQLGIPFVSSASGVLSPPKTTGFDKLIPEEFARRHQVMPLSRTADSLTIACVNPLDLITLDNVSRMTRCEVAPVVTTKTDLEQAITRFYGAGSMLQDAIGQSYEVGEPSAAAPEDDDSSDLDRLREAAE